jgi:hypothetical protein
MEHIKLAGARVVGVVLNRIPLRGADYYAGNSYAYTYYLSGYGDEHKDNEHKIALEKLREILSPYINKVTIFFKHLFETVEDTGADA